MKSRVNGVTLQRNELSSIKCVSTKTFVNLTLLLDALHKNAEILKHDLFVLWIIALH